MTADRSRLALVLAAVGLALLALGALEAPAAPTAQGTYPIESVVVVYFENRSFDHLFGLFPGANGLRAFTPVPGGTPTPPPQVQLNGTPYATFPQPSQGAPGACTGDPRLPPALYPQNAPWQIPTTFLAANLPQVPQHLYYRNQYQINGGRNDLFVAWDHVAGAPNRNTTTTGCGAGALVMGYWDLSSTFLWSQAQQYTLADNFFQAGFGGSWFNHQWLVCACTPRWLPAPLPAVRATVQPYPFDDRPTLYQEAGGSFVLRATDDYAVNTVFPPFLPTPVSPQPPTLPPVTAVTYGGPPTPGTLTPTAVPARHIGNLLDQAGKSWAYYAQSYATGSGLELNHLPFNFYPNPAATPAAAALHLKDYDNSFATAVSSGRLENVVWIKPNGQNSMHPEEGSIQSGDTFLRNVVSTIQSGPQWQAGKVAIVVTWDENGGFYDHVAPPVADQWGPGSRIPAVIISPYARRGFVDHTLYDTTSILKFVETLFGLPALGGERPAVGNLLNAFQFPTTTSTATRTATATIDAGGALRTATPTPTVAVVPPGQNPPASSGQAGVPAASQPGQQAVVSGAVSGTLTVTASMAFTLTATGPANTVVGGVPAVFLPTTVRVESFACGAVTPARQTICTGTTAGNVLQGATITVRFPLLGGGTADVTGIATGPGAAAVAAPPGVIALGPGALGGPSLPGLALVPPLLPPAPFVAPGPPGMAAPLAVPQPRDARAPEVPVVPEGDSLALLAAGLAVVAVWSGRGRRP
jgi:acid phosphatase